jgi:hypothetical protein
MFKLANTETVDLTPELAQRFRDMDASPTERDLNAGRVKYLLEKSAANRLVTFQWSVANYGGRKVRMNGQHSSTALCELNGAFPKGLKVHIDTYDVETKEDLAELFQEFDARKSSRSTGDTAGAFQGLYETLHDVPKASAKTAIDGVTWWRRQIEGMPAPSGDAIYAQFREEGLHAFIRWIGDLFTIKTPELKRTQIVSAMYATFIIHEDAARTFWDQVARGGVEYEDTAPATVLDTWLKKLADKETHGTAKLKPANYYQGCIYAWNAYREDKPLKDIRSDAQKGFHHVL